MRLAVPSTRQLNLTVTAPVYERLQKLAREKGLGVSTYGRVLLEAAYAARHGGTGDDELEAMVAAALLLRGKLDTAQTAMALRTTEATVQKIYKAWDRINGR